MLVLLDESF